jgi:hypothetical protein
MGEGTVDNLKGEFRRRISSFLAFRAAHRRPLKSIFNEISERGWTAFLFGGTLRDLMVSGLSKNPRDLDIVVSKLTPRLEEYLSKYLQKRTRFSGFQACISSWDFDVWALEDTWAFRENRISGKGFSDLPKTTFLDVQAIAAELTSKRGKPRRIYSYGFFEAIASKTININFEDNPFPKHCVLTALATARKLNYAIAPKLVEYILHHIERLELEELVDIQQRNCGQVLFDCDNLKRWVVSLESHHRSSPRKPATLPRAIKAEQRYLPLGFDRQNDFETMCNDANRISVASV